MHTAELSLHDALVDGGSAVLASDVVVVKKWVGLSEASVNSSNPFVEWVDGHRAGLVVAKSSRALDLYHEYFYTWRGKETHLMEIGISNGGSLEMWKAYFGPELRVTGIECCPYAGMTERVQDERTIIMIGDQADADFLQRVVTSVSRPNIVIDDGGHKGFQMEASFRVLYPFLAPGGLYVIQGLERTHDEGLYRHSQGRRSLEFVNMLVDNLHARAGPDFLVDFADTTEAVHVYEGIAIIRKRESRRRESENLRFSAGDECPLCHPMVTPKLMWNRDISDPGSTVSKVENPSLKSHPESPQQGSPTKRAGTLPEEAGPSVQQPIPSTLALSSGHQMPILVFGTAGLGDGTADVVSVALKAGFRAFDTATHPRAGDGFDYRQHLLGEALAQGTVPRSQLFLISKIHPADFGYMQTLGAAYRAVKELGAGGGGYVDLLLLHFPICYLDYCPWDTSMRPLGDFIDAWRGLEEAVRRGIVRSIGVSNFDADRLGVLLQGARVAPAVAGLWADIFKTIPRAFRVLCEKRGIRLQVFGTLGYEWSQGRGLQGKGSASTSRLMENLEVKKIAAAAGLTASEVCVKFFLQQGVSVITGSRNPDRVRDALAYADARLLPASGFEALMDLDGFLDSSLRVHATPDRYASMVGFDTEEMQTISSGAHGATDFNCDDALAAYHRDGVVHLPGHLPEEAVASARRAVQRLVWDNGGGAMEDPESYPARLAREQDFFIDWLDSTGHALLFPLFVALRPLVDCVFGPGSGVLSYLILRGKVPHSDRQHVDWHQDMQYQAHMFTDASTPEKGLYDSGLHAQRSFIAHVPLTPQTRERGALRYARGSHTEGFHPEKWPNLWKALAGRHPEANDFRPEELDGIATFETELGDVLAHSMLVHHGSHPNVAPSIRWHLEVLIRAGDLPNVLGFHEPRVPDNSSLPSLLGWMQDCVAFQQTYTSVFPKLLWSDRSEA